MLSACSAVDYSCIDQDHASPAALLTEHLRSVIAVCDLILTPVHDPKHASWCLPLNFTDLHEEYQAAEWVAYLQRAWCRAESLLATTLPLPQRKKRSELFRGGLHNLMRRGHRPHVIYGTKERMDKAQPRFLQPLKGQFVEKYMPQRGQLTNESDREVICELARTAELVPCKEGYKGEMNEFGDRHGYGKMMYNGGDSYAGTWKQNKFHGYGVYYYAWGDMYEGEFRDHLFEGAGSQSYADGGFFCGRFHANQRDGFGFMRAHAIMHANISHVPSRKCRRTPCPHQTGPGPGKPQHI